MARRIVFVDSLLVPHASGISSLLGDIRVVVLDAASDPLQQMATALSTEHDVSVVEIVSHGGPGLLLLGGKALTAAELEASPALWSSWRTALRPDADVLLMGCNVAAGESGALFLQTFARLSGADVAASTDPSGNPGSNGDWELESSTGPVAEARSLQAFSALRTTLAVVSGTGAGEALTGTAGDDSIYGLGGDDTLDGSSGADLLEGGGGADSLIGGTGDDVYVTDGLDTLVENAAEGNDTVLSSVSATLGSNLENLVLTGVGFLSGTGNALANAITGNNSGNRLDGGAGADTLTGLLGDDTYYIDGADTVIEAADGGLDTAFSDASVTLGANVETLLLTGTAAVSGTGSAGANTLIGNSAANTLNGGGGTDTLQGGAGDDLYVVDGGDTVIESADSGTDAVETTATFTLPDHVENLRLSGDAAINGTGNDLPNIIVGNDAANVLRGGGGYDILAGGLGNDSYVDDGEDTLQELVDQGTDTILVDRNYTLQEHFEVLTLTGTLDLKGTGTFGNDRINGNTGNNTLDGSLGVDTLAGGAGNDTYIVDTLGETVIEAENEGADTVRSVGSFTLGAHVENLVLTGAAPANGMGNTLENLLQGNGWANQLSGLEGNDTLIGGVGSDTLIGGPGDDRYIVSDTADTVTETEGQGTDIVESSVSVTLAAHVEHLVLSGQAAINGTGNDLGNEITGNANANVLDGGSGKDTLRGGGGNDTYLSDGTDVIIEGAGAGIDTVQASASTTLGAHLEKLVLTGTNTSSGTGNGLGNSLSGNSASNALNGLAGRDTLAGGEGNDTLMGGGGNDLLHGDAGADRLLGGTGADTLSGGLGNDTLSGAGGPDVFVFDTALSATANLDTVTFFAPGADKISLDDDVFGALTGAGTVAAEQFLAAPGAKQALTAEHRLIYNTNTGVLYYDADGSGSGSTAIAFAVLAGAQHPSLTAADFIVTG